MGSIIAEQIILILDPVNEKNRMEILSLPQNQLLIYKVTSTHDFA